MFGFVLKCNQLSCEQLESNANFSFETIAGTSSDEIYVAGNHFINDNPSGYIATLDNGKVKEVIYDLEGYRFTDLWVSNDGKSVVAAGRSSGGKFDVGIVVTRDASGTWNRQILDDENYIYSAIWGADTKNVYVAGQLINLVGWVKGDGNLNMGKIFKWDGNSFSEVLTLKEHRIWSVWGTSSSNIFLGGHKWTSNDGGFSVKTLIGTLEQNSLTEATFSDEHPDEAAIQGFCYIEEQDAYLAYTNEGVIFQNIKKE